MYFRYFGGSWSFALMIVPKREKKILLSHYIPSFCSLLQVAFIFSVPSYSPPWCEGLYFPWVSVGFPKKAIFPFVSTFSFPNSVPWAVPRITYGQTRIRSIVDCILLSLYLSMYLADCLLGRDYWLIVDQNLLAVMWVCFFARRA